MAAKKAKATRSAARSPAGTDRDDAGVDAFMRELDHPLKGALELLRRIIMGVSPEIREGIKWNAPSFRVRDYFATINLRAREGGSTRPVVWLILHTGAKGGATEVEVADPVGLLERLGPGRCVVKFADKRDVEAKRGALESVLREWISQV
jgi:hypothetical protein